MSNISSTYNPQLTAALYAIAQALDGALSGDEDALLDQSEIRSIRMSDEDRDIIEQIFSDIEEVYEECCDLGFKSAKALFKVGIPAEVIFQ